MPGKQSGYRARIFRAIHAEAVKRELDHDGLHDLCTERFGVRSMSQVSDGQLTELYYEWTRKRLKRRASLPERKAAREGKPATIVSAEELVDLGAEFARREMGEQSRAAFIRRQLRGRGEIRTRGDFVAVIGGLRAMRKREELASAQTA